MNQRQVTVTPDAFRKQADGSWVCIRNTDVYTPIGAIRINVGLELRKGRTLCGYDIAALLEAES